MQITPKNPFISISELGEQSKFVSGNKYWFIESASIVDALEKNKKEFKKGVKVKWTCPDTYKQFKGKIEWLIITDEGSVEVSIDNNNVGRLELDELEIIK
jgi:hypothetical protein